MFLKGNFVALPASVKDMSSILTEISISANSSGRSGRVLGQHYRCYSYA